jgi:isocitrate dehydrogenase (NAD+)
MTELRVKLAIIEQQHPLALEACRSRRQGRWWGWVSQTGIHRNHVLCVSHLHVLIQSDTVVSMTEVTLIPGDGIGPELVAAARKVLDRAVSSITWDEVQAGEQAFRAGGKALPDAVLDSLSRTRLGLKGPMGVPKEGYLSPNTEIRAKMGLWCNLRVATYFEGARSRNAGTEIVIIRDVTEDSRGAQQSVGPDAGIEIKFITRQSAARVARFGLKYASEHGYHRVTIPNQAPSHRSTDGLFLSTILAIAEEYPGLLVEGEAMDSLSMHLAMQPQDYQVLLCMNTYGGILGGHCAGLVGGVGLMAGVNLSDSVAVFETGHGNAPKYAGLNKVNPAAMILCGAMLLERIGELETARRVRSAVAEVIRQGHHVTYDQGGTATTTDMADAVLAQL